MLNTTEVLMHIILERKVKKKIIVIDSSDDEENKKRRIRKRKYKGNIDGISQGLFIKQKEKKNEKKLQQKISQIVLPETELKKTKEKQK